MKRLSRGVASGATLVASLTLLGLSACAEPSAPAHRNPDLEGRITLLVGGAAVSGVLVDDLHTPATGYTQIHLVLKPPSGRRAVVFVRTADGTLVRGTAADLRVGAQLRAWVQPTERRSLPPQWDAVRVIVQSPRQP